MKIIIPYLTFNGNAEEALNFYKSIFGGEITELSRYEEAPPMEGVEITDEHKKLVMNASFTVNDTVRFMVSDGHPAFDKVPFGKNLSLVVSTETKEEADKYFNGLSQGGNITMPIDEVFWGAYFGMVEDKFGVNWMINFDFG